MDIWYMTSVKGSFDLHCARPSVPTLFPPNFASFQGGFCIVKFIIVWFIEVHCFIFHYLFESFMQHAFWIHHPFTPYRQSSPSLPIQLYIHISLYIHLMYITYTYILIYWDHFTFSKYSWTHGHLLEQCLITRNNNLRENSLSQPLTIVNNFTARGGISS